MEEYSKINANEYAQIALADKIVTSELSSDFTLPDYQPEIKRLLKISACVLPPSKYIGDNNAEFAGNVDYLVFYTGSDNEMYCAPLTGEYKIDVPVEQCGQGPVSNLVGGIDIVPDMISGRVISPRKVSIKCRLKAGAKIFGDVHTEREFDGSDDNEVLGGVVSSARMLFGTGEMHRLSDEMIIDHRDGEIRVISAQGNVLLSEISCSDGVVNCRGDVYLKILMTRDSGGQSYYVTRKIPMSQSVSVDGAQGICKAIAKATVCETGIEVEDNKLAIDVGVMTDVTVIKNERVRYVKDLYSTRYKTDCTYKPMRIYSSGAALNANFTFSDSASLEDVGISPECTVLDCAGTATVDTVQYDDGGRMSAIGKVRFALLLDKNGEYLISDIEMPFRYSADVGVKADVADDVCATVISCRARMDGERVGIDAEISLCGTFCESKQISVLDEVSFGEELDKPQGEFVLCYPSRTDSLWSVAKRYGVAVSELVKNNKSANDAPYDSRESLDGISYLFV